MLEQEQKDYLTGFFTRATLNPFLEKLILESQPANKRFSLALIDLDRFKKFNDRFGHAFGDEILKYATSTMRLTFYGNPCYLFRYGGDEFVAVFPEKEPKEISQVTRTCGYNLRRRPFLFENKLYKISLSCGIACFPADGQTAAELIDNADRAMYFSKRNGRNLTTIAARIPFLRVRNGLLIIVSAAMIGYSFLALYQIRLKKVIQPTMRQIQSLKITTRPASLDTVILKSGVVLEGRVLLEQKDKVILNLYMEKGEGVTSFDRKEVAEIRYGAKGKKKE